MKKLLRTIIATVSLVALVGCATSVPPYLGIEAEASGGSVYLYRERAFYQSVASPHVTIDGELAAYIQNGRYLEWRLAPGRHTIALKRDAWRNPYGSGVEMTFDVEENEEYFLKTGFGSAGAEFTGISGIPFIPSARNFLVLVPEEKARREMELLRPNDAPGFEENESRRAE